MPTNMFKSRTIFDDTNIGILYTMHDLASPKMATIDPATVSPDATGQKILPPGTLIVRGNGAASGFARPFPGSFTIAAVSGSPTIPVKDARSLRVGDVLVTTSNAAVGTILSVSGNTITLTGNTTTALSNGDPVFVNITPTKAEIVGLTVAPHDLINDPNDVAGYLSASVYRDRLPFWSATLETLMPEIKLCP